VAEALGMGEFRYEDYFSPEYVFNNVYEAEFALPKEFDWWNSPQGYRLMWGN
jgi:hypothetical protein